MELSALQIRVARTPGLGMLPQVTAQILKLVDNPNASARQVGALIERDAGLATKLLKTANSPYYGMSGKVRTVSQAISVMGLSAVRSTIVSQAYQQMAGGRAHARRFDKVAFWQHSLATAVAARILARFKGWRDPEEAFLTGLLHDAGRLVMDRFLTSEFDQAITLSLERGCPLIDAEREVLGYTHVEVGLLLGEQWQLPESLLEGIRRHHEAVPYESSPIGCLVAAANVLAHQVGFAVGAPVVYELSTEIQASLQLPPEQFEGLKQALVQEVTRTQEVLKI
ncbi:MAG: HDOD domain-containing protein [Armatimonadota bacterium]